MTARRQENKVWLTSATVFAAVFAFLPWLANDRAWAVSSQRVVTDRFSGLAIDGYDPVAYFTDKDARPGLPDFEASQGGAIWQFRNDRNRAIFLANPEIYGPRFGGYDPVDLARGKVVAGRPLVWRIVGQRLYLFRTPENRDAFVRDSSCLAKAMDNWPRLSATLADY